MRTFIITGASRGLGEALIAYIMDKSNHRVISLSRSKTHEQSSYDSKRFSFIYCDLEDLNNLESISFALKNEILSQEVIFISNAGIIEPIKEVGSLGMEEIKRAFYVNVIAPFSIVNMLVSRFVNTKMTFINISTGASTNPISKWSIYCSSKAAAAMFYNVLKKEKPSWEIINIDPGVIDTNMQAIIRNSDFEHVEKFRSFKKEGVLQLPQLAAEKILSAYL